MALWAWLMSWFRNPEPSTAGIPPELLTAINAAGVTWRTSGDDSSTSRPIVRVRGLGVWYWDGVLDAAARVRFHFPELTPGEARRVAALIGDQVAAQNRVRRSGPYRGGAPWLERY